MAYIIDGRFKILMIIDLAQAKKVITSLYTLGTCPNRKQNQT